MHRGCLFYFVVSIWFVPICVCQERLQIDPESFHWQHGGLSLTEMQQKGRISDVWDMRAQSEQRRLSSISEVPHSVPAFTELGFHKEQFDPEAWRILQEFWQQNKARKDDMIESWVEDDIFVNHYDVTPTILHIPQTLKDKLRPYIQRQISAWAGVEYEDLEFTSLYGIRSYHMGSLLRNHPDRDDVLVLSMIVNVDQDIDEPWPLEIYDHSGNLHEFFLSPGEIVFYESAACVHGRPTPLRGRYYANFFAHFRPVGWLETVRNFRDEHNIPDPKEGVIKFSGRQQSDGWGGVSHDDL